MVSVYLDYADNKSEDGWHVCAQFALVISNPYDPRIYSTSREYSPIGSVRSENIADQSHWTSPRSQRPTTASLLRKWTGASPDSMSFAS